MADRFALWIAATWAVSLTMLGLFVVPLLFVYLPSPAIAGAMAGHLFQFQTAISSACALTLLGLAWHHIAVPRVRRMTAMALAGLVCAVAVEYWVAPHILVRDHLALWHRIGSGLYFLQWLAALAVFHWHTKGWGAAPTAT